MKYMYLAAFALVILAACSPVSTQDTTTNEQQPTSADFECWDGSTAPTQADCPPQMMEQDETEEPESSEAADDSSEINYRPGEGIITTDESATQGVTAELSEMRERAQQRTSNGYSYTYVKTVDGQPTNTIVQTARIYRKANQMAIELPDEEEYQGYNINYILAQDDALEGKAYCQDCRGAEGETISIPEIATPFEYLEGLQNSEFEGEQGIDSRNSFRISGTYNGEEITLYADTFSGLPLRVDYENARIDFKDIALGASDEVFNP